jgi:hypothetical protein
LTALCQLFPKALHEASVEDSGNSSGKPVNGCLRTQQQSWQTWWGLDLDCLQQQVMSAAPVAASAVIAVQQAAAALIQ